MEHAAAITDLGGGTFVLTVWRGPVDDGQVLFSDMVWLEGREVKAAAVDRLQRAGWRVIGEWREEAGALVAEVGPALP